MKTPAALAAITVLLTLAVLLQVWRDRGWQPYEPATPITWLQAGPALERALLGFSPLAADVYWIRAVVYFGRQGLSDDPDKNYDLLYPFLDLVTSLDPRFTVAYRFGAIFLSEPPPSGPGRPDLAIRLLERGVASALDRWEYAHDIGFVHYWHYRDFAAGAAWMNHASQVPGAPIWLKSTAAAMLTEGGDRESARGLWLQIHDSADNDLLRNMARLRLLQFDAMEAIDELNVIVWRFAARAGTLPTSWRELVAAGMIKGVPIDPSGTPYVIDPDTESVRVSDASDLWPMPKGFTGAVH
ncbi:MAG: hypothetical protein ACT4QD_21820 [Acidobacteriota bacterium]